MPPAKVEGDPDQETVPEYPSPEVIVLTGVAPVTGATKEIACIDIVVAVEGKTAVTTPEFAE